MNYPEADTRYGLVDPTQGVKAYADCKRSSVPYVFRVGIESKRDPGLISPATAGTQQQ